MKERKLFAYICQLIAYTIVTWEGGLAFGGEKERIMLTAWECLLSDFIGILARHCALAFR
ncbi:MAG: hypothetical protein COA78_32795 [Blastopirellula sp.]|nr:MAG: hypothetical protein COA78_32795 [Blastopirellula sp.]